MLEFLLPRLSLIIWFIAVAVTLFGTVIALIHLRPEQGEEPDDETGLEAISILKPLKGVDEGLEENLESFLSLDYPEYEVLFSVADAFDPVVPLVKKVMARHPHTRARLMICTVHSGPNPKINNLLTAYHSAQHEWILISDSNTRVSSGHLRLLAHQFKNGVAMQTSVVAGIDAHGLGGHLESAFLNTFYARFVLTLNALNHPCVIGKAMLFRKSVLERTGGLQSLEVHIAEDYAAGRRLHQLGFHVQVSRNPIRQYLGPYTFQTFWSRHIRWGRLRKLQTPLGFLLEPLFNSILSGVLGAVASHRLFGVPPLLFLISHLSFWFLSDYLLYNRVAGRPGAKFGLIWILRELLHFPLWIHIGLGNTIHWRGKKIRLIRPKFSHPHAHMLHGLHEYLRKPYHEPMVPLKTNLDLRPPAERKES